jgi:hypothetical protein
MTKTTPSHITYARQGGAGTVPGAGRNAVGRVVAYGDVLELTPELLEQVGPDWVAERIASGKWAAGTLDDNAEIKRRREEQDAAERQRFELFKKTGL